MDISVGSSVVHTTLTFLSVGTVVKIHDNKGQKIFEVMWPGFNSNGFHSDYNLKLSTEIDQSAIADKTDCWY